MKLERKNLYLYAVTDRDLLKGRSLEQAVEQAIQGGAGIVQLREKSLSEDEFIREAVKIKAVTQKYGVPLIINDNIEVCLKSGADGVHLGQKDETCAYARKILGDNAIIGVSAKTVQQALAAEAMGADYLGVGAAFGSSTKKDAVGIDKSLYGEITSAVKIPVVAIGGITAENMGLLSNSGVWGAAVVSALFGKDDVRKAAENLRALSEMTFK
ncbi:MAG: thiamine phosphate synthase [Eubacterium sp.]|nr:thiamine phosphate synthase [Eubacterium sp.]